MSLEVHLSDVVVDQAPVTRVLRHNTLPLILTRSNNDCEILLKTVILFSNYSILPSCSYQGGEDYDMFVLIHAV